MFENFFNYCIGCRKKKFFVCKRTYKIPKITAQPVVSEGRLCGACYRVIKRNIVKKII